jgi:hypothetical protein
VDLESDLADIRSLLDPRLNASLYGGRASEELYLEGYRLAAEQLISHVAQRGADQDFLVYPIVFLYRHYVELRLKDLIAAGRKLADGLTGPAYGHHLAKLWAEARGHLEREFPSSELDGLDRAEQLVVELSDTDPNSESFRYHRSRRGDPHMQGRDHLNLGQFAGSMRELTTFLDRAGAGLDHHLELKSEIESETGG